MFGINGIKYSEVVCRGSDSDKMNNSPATN